MGNKRLEVCQLINHVFVSSVFTFFATTSTHGSLAEGQAGFRVGIVPTIHRDSVLLVHVLMLQTSYNSD